MNNILLYGGASVIGFGGLVFGINLYDTLQIVNRYCEKEFTAYEKTGDDEALTLCIKAEKKLGGGSSDVVSPLKGFL